MKVLVTGASGFAGRWLVRELESAGHTAIPAPRVANEDLWNVEFVRARVLEARPDAVAHLAAVSFGPDAAADPDLAMQTNAGGTHALVEALASIDSPIALLVTGSSEVYGRPDPSDLPLTEAGPLRAIAPYGLSKLAQETVALEGAAKHGIPTAVTRAFNHTGPGQRPVFAAPAFARRVLAVRDGRATTIPAGNVDVRRDLGDVRDVVVAYRLVLEWLNTERPSRPLIANISTGHSVSMREVIAKLLLVAGVDALIEVDPTLVRSNDPADIRGDASLLRRLTGWVPRRQLDDTLRDLLWSEAEHERAHMGGR